MSDVGGQIFYLGCRMSDILCRMSDGISKFPYFCLHQANAQRSQKNGLAQTEWMS